MSDIAIDFPFGFSRAIVCTLNVSASLPVLETVRLPFVDAFRSYPSTLNIIAQFPYRVFSVGYLHGIVFYC